MFGKNKLNRLGAAVTDLRREKDILFEKLEQREETIRLKDAQIKELQAQLDGSLALGNKWSDRILRAQEVLRGNEDEKENSQPIGHPSEKWSRITKLATENRRKHGERKWIEIIESLGFEPTKPTKDYTHAEADRLIAICEVALKD